ncbi:IucA/IucC family protein [Streptomyces winkii]|uniref:IucA/IucC family protein n=1 Tax=Streptomyces winkii TaxID=3051178 RepID=UPI0028D0A60E|nr:IucA/IucC family protein [Streptomyces sp. DSM 40971]
MPGTTTAHPPVPAPAVLPSADDAVAHTLLNCVLREMTDEHTRRVNEDGLLLLRLPLSGAELRVALRRTSLIGAHRFTGPVHEHTPQGWTPIGWYTLAARVHAELSLRTGIHNDEFLAQVAASHRAVSSALARPRTSHGRVPAPRPGDRLAAYLGSEQSLLLGHRFHPTPKAHGADPATWAAYAPEEGARFPLRLLAVREDLVDQDSAEHGALAPLDGLGEAPAGFRLLPAHPWQFHMLHRHPAFAAALSNGDVRDLGTGTAPVTPTASVRTVYDGTAFLKFSLDVRITNCLRKNAHYELTGAVALTRLLRPVLEDLAVRHPGAAVLREPAYRTLAVRAPDGRADRALLEGFGVIVREGLGPYVPAGATPLLAAALADEYPAGPGRVAALLDGAGPSAATEWWGRYVDLVVPPVLSAFFLHGLILEPHLQNVVVCVDDEGAPVRVVFRDLEGTKLVAGTHREALATLPREVARVLTYDVRRGWDRVVYCLLVNHLADMLAAVADLYPGTEAALWRCVRRTLAECAGNLGDPPLLRSLLAGEALPAKANLLTRWQRVPDREAGYVRLPSPLTDESLADGTNDTNGHVS